LLAKTLLANYDFWMDHYLSVNLRSFRRIIDALGGIDVTLPYDVYRKEFEEPVLFLKAGSHHLDGKQTEMLARQRIQIGDYGRINNQTIILKAVAAKMLSPAGIAALPDLAEQLRDNVKTDLSPSDIRQLVCLAGSIDYQEDVVFVSFPEELLTQQMVYDPTRGINTAALVGDPAEITRLIDDFEAGFWP
jgi:anionic cell wall polymer biosynthesis LytR-Cps2A-Psr (LCP) family protein